jgi:S1/P1 Nuclease
MLSRQLGVVMCAALFFMTALPAFAWDDSGHKLTAYIAWQRMTPETRAEVIRLLRAAPEDAQLATFYMSYGAQSEAARKLDFFMTISSWPDIVKDRAFETRYKKYNKSNWHYTDTFWAMKDGKVELVPAPEEGGHALEKVIDFDKTMRDAKASDAEKAIAISWFLHVIGDLHQPLHTSARVTDTEPKGDQGGNLFLLTPKDTPRESQDNLHRFWDSIINRSIPIKNDACDTDYLEPIGNSIMKKYPQAKLQARIEPGQFENWMKESFALATTDVFSADLKRFETPSAAYKKKALRISEEQIALAGYRIADTFNAIFGARGNTASDSIPCKVIRKVMYPVTHTSSVKQSLEIALLDLCPTQAAARPMFSFMVNGKMVMKEYDVVKVFKTEAEARKYGADNNITDINF